MSKYLKKLIIKLIRLIESYEYRALDLDQNDPDKKIIDSKVIDISVSSDSGFVNAYAIHKTQPFDIWSVELDNGYKLDCADNHVVFTSRLEEIFVKDLRVGDYLFTDEGAIRVKSVSKSEDAVSMFDLTVNTEEHRFFTNGILSHNTITASIFLSWYMIFHYDKNIMIGSNKGDTSKEILNKTKSIIEHLPFFLKPAMNVWNMNSIASDSNCRMIATTTSGKAAIGYTVHVLYLDEFAHIHKNVQKPFYDNIYPTISASKSSKLIMTSTPNGYDLFQELYDKSVKGLNEYKSIMVPWWRIPGRDQDWANKEISNIGEEAFNEHFNCSFLRSDTLLLHGALLKVLNDNCKDYVHHELSFLSDKYLSHNDLVWDPDYDISRISKDKIVISIDLAEGIGRDYTVMQIFKIDPKSKKLLDSLQQEKFDLSKFFTLTQIGQFRSNLVTIDDFAKLCYMLFYSGDFFMLENTKVVLEWNTYGSFFVEKLKNMFGGDNYDDSIFVRTKHRKGAKYFSIGLRQDVESKPRNAADLKSKIQNNDIIITEKQTVKEFSFFSRNKKGSFEAAVGHDDCVMACVNTVEIHRGIEWQDIIGEVFDDLEKTDVETYKRISDIIGRGYSNDDSTDFLADSYRSSSLSDDVGDWF